MNNLITQIRNEDYLYANSIIRQVSGIVDYFSSEVEKNEFISAHDTLITAICEDKKSYGDWQTPIPLAEKICEKHISKFGSPDIVIEPTCGLGAFVFSALKKFPDLSEIHALEINYQYTVELKLKLLLNALDSPLKRFPDIYIYNADFFDFDFTDIIKKAQINNWNLAIIGNPPWVTNSRQGRNNSNNVPVKSNNFGLKGIEALTGKSNFDISEYITLQLLKTSQSNSGGISFLLKNSVIRNILMKQRTMPIHVGNIEQESIDTSSEFNVSVEASCFSARLDSNPSLLCSVKDFYTGSFIHEFGWVKDSFVSDTELYQRYSEFDKLSPYIWRSGIKHDCAAVLELTLTDGIYTNGLGEIVNIENDLIYPLLKSSDINNYHKDRFRKFIIVTQHRTGDDTSSLKYTYPSAYSYLSKHESAFANRKSSIYRGKDKFSIFGIGEYSFKPYKIVVSSLYKTIRFILVSQFKGKPILVDDTCYQLDFDDLEEATFVYDALKSEEIQSLLKSLTFTDAKRVVTKGLLMRLNPAQFCNESDSNNSCVQYLKNCHGRQLSLFE